MQSASPGPATLLRFDVFELDVEARQLRKRHRQLKVQDLPIRLLIALLERPGEVVTREQLGQRLWGNTAVEVDDGLHTAVRKLREVLGDSAVHSKFIGTVPRRGYRFLAQVEAAGEPKPELVEIVAPVAMTEAESVASRAASLAGLPTWVWMVACVLVIALLASLRGFFIARPGVLMASAADVVPITSYRGLQRSPALSPDGTKLAFLWVGQSGNNLDLYVQRLDGSALVRLTTDPAPDESPRWSPDRKTIAFIRSGSLLLIPATGGAERKLTSANGTGLSWSPDGGTIAFADRPAADEPSGLFLFSLRSGARRPLTAPANGGENDSWPAVSPDGLSLAFVRTATSATGIFRVPLAGGVPTRVLNTGRPLRGVVWTPDSRFLLFATGRHGPGLFAVRASARDSTRMDRVDLAGFDVSEPSVIPNGRLGSADLVYGHESADCDIWSTAFGESVALPRVPLAASTRVDQAPAFSPDGRLLAFSSARSGYEEIWISNSDGSDPRQLTNLKSPVGNSPRWSPDGEWIAFDNTVSNNPDVYIIRKDGAMLRRITTESSADTQPNWSHDGRWLYFMSDRSGSKQIWKVSRAGGDALQITFHGGVQAFESQDGRFLYYAKRQHGSGVWRVPVDGGEETLVTAAGFHNLWTLSGNYIYFIDVSDQVPQIFSVERTVPIRRLDLATRQIMDMAKLTLSLPIGVPALDVKPDGKSFAWVGWRDQSAELMMAHDLRLSQR